MQNKKVNIRELCFVEALKQRKIKFEAEYRFNPDRRWRFDYAIIEHKIAIEIEGGCWIRGRHSRGVGMVADMEKYNTATILGWKILRYTPQNISLAMLDIERMIHGS
jgi:very-short-patch-repair endonuclease